MIGFDVIFEVTPEITKIIVINLTYSAVSLSVRDSKQYLLRFYQLSFHVGHDVVQ